ncbi:hypothetical protein ACHHYP_16701 [Achlya hypogyna]|uniref:Chromatin-remodeling ATPase INO80 n=1 Tax=Achlya hypogyna TaxID=1202772 RepID=A0A1V9Y5Z7_ACHHY|nr:hypothetical protein ACHHYP_16701 [Achlya hypogyna]
MTDALRKLLCVDHLPLLAAQLAAPGSGAHVAIAPMTREPREDAPTGLQGRKQSDQRNRGKLEIEACYVGTEMNAAMPNKGALIGDIYDTIPDESDELVYDALEKAYNAAFTMSSTQKVERDRKVHCYMNDTSFVHVKPKGATDATSPVETIDTWRNALLDGRRHAIFNVVKKHALREIDAYKAHLRQQRDEKLEKLQQHVLEGSAKDIWATAVVGTSVHNAATGVHDRREHRRSVLATLAKQCQDAHARLQSRARSGNRYAPNSLRTNDSSSANSPKQRRQQRDKPVMISRQRDVLGDNAKMIHFLLTEADVYAQLLLGDRVPSAMTNDEHFSSAALGLDDVARVAEITASTLFQQHTALVGEFDAEWQRWRQRALASDRLKELLPPSSPGASPTTVAVPNPFQDAASWAWLHEPAPAMLAAPADAHPSLRQMKLLYARGTNGILVPTPTASGIEEVVALLADLGKSENRWGPHLVVARPDELAAWEAALEAAALGVLTYWGSDEHRLALRAFWGDERVRGQDAPFHVVLTTYRVLRADCDHWHALQWQLVVYARPFPSAQWPELLGVRCRQRWLLTPYDTSVDARVLLHFTLPELFDSKQKTLAWGTAGLDNAAVDRLVRVLARVTLHLGDGPLFPASVAATVALGTVERAVLEQRDATPVTEYVLSTPLLRTERRHLARFKKARTTYRFSLEAKKRLLQRSHLPATAFETPAPVVVPTPPPTAVSKTPAPTDPKLIACKHCAKTFMTSSGLLKHTKSDHAPAGTWTCRKCGTDCGTMALRNAHERQEHDETIGPSNKPSQPLPPAVPATPPASAPSAGPKKRTRSSGSRAKKRVTRCGKCPGCLAGDCMECGHCQDMKKYGGPGLRKQSCKNRKCVNPQVMPSSSVSSSAAAVMDDDDDDDADGAPPAAAKPEDDGHSTESQASSDSDQSKLDDDMDDSMDESMDDGYLDDAPLGKVKTAKSSSSKRRSKASLNNRSRVMRCGVCVGCLAPDCMKCRHCQDMKKYGGPGLRKQSCKSRKCVAPKVVVLNQGTDDEDGLLLLGDDAAAYSWPPKSTVAVTPAWERDTVLDLGSGLGLRYLLQRQLDRLLPVPCMTCETRFPNAALKALHHHVVHAKRSLVPRWQRLLAGAMAAPAVQYSLLASDMKRKTPLDSEPAGYAKLMGPGLCYYMLQPEITLGRLSSKWRDRYRSLGVNFSRGLAGGKVDCHLGDDLMISAEHARIRWDVARQQFTIECLSFLTSISVNGRDLALAAGPLPLRSRNLVQIGAFYFFFLLPTGNSPASVLAPGPPAEAMPRQVLPRAEVLTWLASKRKRLHDQLGTNAKRPRGSSH